MSLGSNSGMLGMPFEVALHPSLWAVFFAEYSDHSVVLSSHESFSGVSSPAGTHQFQLWSVP